MRPPVPTTPSSNSMGYRRARSPWSAEEDRELSRLVNRFGPSKWHIIANFVPGRSGQSCRSRWHNHLSAQVNTEPVTIQESVPQPALQQEYGNSWTIISESILFLPDSQINDQYNLLVRNDCYEFPNPSPVTNSHVTLNTEMPAFSLYTPPNPSPFTNSNVTLNTEMPALSSFAPPPVAIGPQSSLFSGLGNGSVVGSQSAHPRGMPSGSGSSAFPRGRSPFPPQHTNSGRSANLLNTLARERHLMAGCANVQPSLGTQPQPEQESVVEEQKFFDFMGVGTSK